MPHPRETLSASDRSDLRDAHNLVLHRPPTNGATLWRNVALVVLGIVVTLGGTYIRDAISRQDLVSRDELRAEMMASSPYAVEREMLREWRLRADARLTALESRLDQLHEEISAIQLYEAREHHPTPGGPKQ